MDLDYYLVESRASRILQTVVAIPMSIIIWAVVYILFMFFITFLDQWRGLYDNWLQSIFREVFTPFMASGAALYATYSCLPGVYIKITLWMLCVPAFLFMVGPSVGYMGIFVFSLPVESWQYPLGDQIISWFGGVSAVFGAWAVQQEFSHRRLEFDVQE